VNIGELVHKTSSDSEIAEMSFQVIETILKKAGYFCSKYKVIFFTEHTLFSKGFTKNSEIFLNALSKKRIKIVYLTTKELEEFEGHKKYLNEIYKIKKDKTDLLKILEKIAKKYNAELKECAIFTNVQRFSTIIDNFGLSLCFTNSHVKLKEKCKTAHSLSDTFLFLE
jgi:3-deoxy-D-manno-octulosonate 8-phosphate phosphatase KdsC-like HAD superfamily phosphatase